MINTKNGTESDKQLLLSSHPVLINFSSATGGLLLPKMEMRL